MTDRLGSVTQLVTTAGVIASQFTFDPYGNRATVSGTVVPDIGYAGYFAHAMSGLDFTGHRAYDPAHARWLNRDPIGEIGSINLYAYVNGNPTSLKDPTGLAPFPYPGFPGWTGQQVSQYGQGQAAMPHGAPSCPSGSVNPWNAFLAFTGIGATTFGAAAGKYAAYEFTHTAAPEIAAAVAQGDVVGGEAIVLGIAAATDIAGAVAVGAIVGAGVGAVVGVIVTIGIIYYL